MARIQLENISKVFGRHTALEDLELDVADGEFFVLLGPTGAGKTTTLRLIAGLEKPTVGRVKINDIDVNEWGAAERDVSMVFQSYALFPHLNVLDNVMYGPLASGASKNEARDMAREKLGLLGLAGFEARLPSELSGGQQQRVAVARAIVLEPRVLLFDEPLSNLDARLRRKVRDEIRELQQRLGLTVVYVTHDQQEALAVSDKVIVMANAVIAQQGSPEKLYERPRTRFLADFIGESNIIEGEFSNSPDGPMFRTKGFETRLGATTIPDGATAIALRPDRIRLTPARDGQIEVRRRVYLGHAWEYTLAAPWGDLLVFAPIGQATIEPGARISIDIDPDSAIPLV